LSAPIFVVVDPLLVVVEPMLVFGELELIVEFEIGLFGTFRPELVEVLELAGCAPDDVDVVELFMLFIPVLFIP
jgi:hypothetical protein